MRRKILTLLMTSAVILSALLIPTVLAKKHMLVSGVWSWTVPIVHGVRVADGNTFISAVEDDTFTGTFEGDGYGDFKITIHPNGFTTGSGRTTFTGTVDDHSGTCVIMWVGNTKNDQGWWWFKWIIISGEDGLANLRGSGYSWGVGPSGVDMFGRIHFDPS